MHNMIGYLDNQIREVDQLEIPTGEDVYLDNKINISKNQQKLPFGNPPLGVRTVVKKKKLSPEEAKNHALGQIHEFYSKQHGKFKAGSQFDKYGEILKMERGEL